MTRAIDVVRQVAPHAKTNYLSAFEITTLVLSKTETHCSNSTE